MLSQKLAIISALGLFFSSPVYGWILESTHQGATFFDGFDFFTASDPTHGFVQYVDKNTAINKHLIYNQGSQTVIKTDNTTVTPNGRPSIRIVSKASYNKGVFLLDLEHMPTGCGTWPAYWMVGPDWPNSGEIDIIEGVNKDTNNQMTLHSKAGCTMEGVAREQIGTTLTANCDINAPGQGTNVGCGVRAPSSNTFGAGLNNNKGGVYAVQWTWDGGVQIWFFARNSIPADITNNDPNPYNWGTPLATFPFQSNCPTSFFKNQQIVINLTFCGDWAGSVYGSSGCPSDCVSYVRENPSAFDEAYWRINYLKVYQ